MTPRGRSLIVPVVRRGEAITELPPRTFGTVRLSIRSATRRSFLGALRRGLRDHRQPPGERKRVLELAAPARRKEQPNADAGGRSRRMDSSSHGALGCRFQRRSSPNCCSPSKVACATLRSPSGLRADGVWRRSRQRRAEALAAHAAPPTIRWLDGSSAQLSKPMSGSDPHCATPPRP